MTLTLSKDTIRWLLEMQEKLDASIREKKGISDVEWVSEFGYKHDLALAVEISEFINECHDLWKYWKSKPVNKERILDEAIDVIHFVMLLGNKSEYSVKIKSEVLFHTLEKDNMYKMKLEEVLHSINDTYFYSEYDKLAGVLRILDHYGFTEQDIIEQYKRKNAINFERLEEGY